MAPPAPLEAAQLVELEIAPATGNAILTLRGEHDLNTMPLVVEALVAAAACRCLLVDLSGCEFADSSLVAVLRTAAEDMHRRGGHIDLVIPPAAPTRRLAEATHLAASMPVHDSPQSVNVA